MSTLNDVVIAATKGILNMTFFVGSLHKVTGEFSYVLASHEPPILIRKSALDSADQFRDFLTKIEFLTQPNGASLGMDPKEVYREGKIKLEPGDRILFHSDGFPELQNAQTSVWGDRGFANAVFLALRSEGTLESFAQSVVGQAKIFAGGVPAEDDLTLMVIEFKGQESVKKAWPKAS